MIYLLPHTILESANRFPDRPAFRFGNKELTYAQFVEQVNQLAFTLQELGIQKGDRVGIYLNRSLETAIAIYGILQAGGVYVPLDPKAPVERTCFLIKDCQINILITNPSQKRNTIKIVDQVSLKAIIGSKEVLPIPTLSWETLANQPTNFQSRYKVMERDLAYIMYTSGSTGNPKGIMHTHASGLAYAKLSAHLYGLTEKDVVGNHAPIYFDISTFGYFSAPLASACTVIASDAHTILPASLAQLLEKEKISVWYSVPLALIQLVQHGVIADKDMSALRWVLYGGEPFPPKYMRQLMETWSHAQFSNVYGPAEVNQCTYYTIPQPPSEEEAIPLGDVWGNTQKVILNEYEEELQEGTGELCIRSSTMMQGYWNQPELTERSLYLRKNNRGTYDKYYRTGDLVRIDKEGLLHFIGRKDHQVKIRGYRVELAAVEAMLVSHPAIAEAAVFTIRKEAAVQEIVAAVIVKTGKEVTAKMLQQHLKNKLPTYAVPSQINIVKTFPRTGSGKVKRAELKEAIYS